MPSTSPDCTLMSAALNVTASTAERKRGRSCQRKLDVYASSSRAPLVQCCQVLRQGTPPVRRPDSAGGEIMSTCRLLLRQSQPQAVPSLTRTADNEEPG